MRKTVPVQNVCTFLGSAISHLSFYALVGALWTELRKQTGINGAWVYMEPKGVPIHHSCFYALS